MAEQYEGNANSYPTNYTIPDDSDPPTAAAFNVAAEALGDRTAWLRANVMQPLLNFSPRQALTGCAAACYDPANRRWYVAGSDSSVWSSRDFGLTFDGDELAYAGVGTTEDATGIAADTTGNVVIATNTNKVFEKTIATDAWTMVTLPFSPTGATTRVAFDPVRSLWCVVMTDLGAIRIATSSNRTSWTSRTPSAAMSTDYWTPIDLAVNATTGRLVLAAASPGGTVLRVATSDDGGATWTDRAALTVSSQPNEVAVSFDPVAALFMLVTTDTSPIKSEVWTSTDAITWTKRCTLTNSRIGRAAPVGGVWLAIAVHTLPQFGGPHYELAFSADKGVTWKPTGMRIDGFAVGVYSHPKDGGALVVTSAYVWHSGRCGTPTFPALT